MEIVLAYDRPDELLALVREYIESILQHGRDIELCLSTQNMDKEFSDLGKKYAMPDGRAYIALVNGKAAGCAALMKNDEENCELKRVFVRPEYRGMGIGKALSKQIISDAKEIRYKHIRLDTFLFMGSALKIYRELGFYDIPQYNDNPADNVVYLQLDLF